MFRHGGAISSNKETAEKFVESLKTLWLDRNLFPNMYSIVTGKAYSGKKAKKDFKVKPLSVYHSENPKNFRDKMCK